MSSESRKKGERHVVTEEVRDMIEVIEDPELRKEIVHEVRQVLDEILEAANQHIIESDPFYKSKALKN